MFHIFEEQVVVERRKKRANRPFASLERFMLFATDGDDESAFTFFNFATRQHLSGRKVPMEAVAEQQARRPPPPVVKKKVTRATAASQAGSRGRGSRPREEKAQPTPAPPTKPRPFSKEQLAKLRAQAVPTRKNALSLRPRSLPELLLAARMLHVDLILHPQLVWLVDLCLACDHLPTGWEPVAKEDMSAFATLSSADAVSMQGMMAKGSGEFERAQRHVHDVTWLPPLERLWHVATTGAAPPQYKHLMCDMVTERHPLQGFVHKVLGLEEGEIH